MLDINPHTVYKETKNKKKTQHVFFPPTMFILANAPTTLRSADNPADSQTGNDAYEATVHKYRGAEKFSHIQVNTSNFCRLWGILSFWL